MIRGADDGGSKFLVKDYKEEQLDDIFRGFFQGWKMEWWKVNEIKCYIKGNAENLLSWGLWKINLLKLWFMITNHSFIHENNFNLINVYNKYV